MIRFVLALLLIAITRPLVWAAEDRSAAEARFEQEQEIENQVFLAGYQRFVKEMRAVAILEACDKSGLAKSIGASVDAKFEFLARKTMRKEAWSDTSLAFLQGLTSQEVTSISEKATDRLWGYAGLN